ncbi:hypothetical protein BDV98DRAFT_15519 [Pterulicium gracile]|uniref:Uncharacterized protein n=1 Tax=Pterulicium gracile TaxID=1884261 RepID=A0A5C3R100_9AGAR|nr:hypothetical protein BDV98DRAFT_15519 [Pterula gracilis]
MALVESLHSASDVELYSLTKVGQKSSKVTYRALLDLTRKHDYNLERFYDYLDEAELTWSQICKSANLSHPDIISIYFLPTAKTLAPRGSEGEEQEEQEEVGSLSSRYFEKLRDFFQATRDGPTPSQGALSLFAKHQEGIGKRKGVYDGRTTDKRPPRVASPVEVHHPVFAEFKRHLAVPLDDTPWDIIILTTKLFQSAVDDSVV